MLWQHGYMKHFEALIELAESVEALAGKCRSGEALKLARSAKAKLYIAKGPVGATGDLLESECPSQWPQSLNTPEFAAAWLEWVEYRREKRQKITPTTERKQWKKLAQHSPAVAVRMLERSIENGWTGLFDLPPAEIAAISSAERKPAASAETLTIGRWQYAKNKPPKRSQFAETDEGDWQYTMHMQAWEKWAGRKPC